MIGSGKKSIVIQFCLENALIIFSSLLLGFYIFSKILLPGVNKIIGVQLREMVFTWNHDYPLVFLFLLVAAFITVIAGTIPVLNMTALKVTEAVKGRLSANTGNTRIRNIFITTQFALAVLFICITLILNSQIRYMKGSSLGFNKEDLAVVNLNLAFKDEKAAAARFDALLNSLKSNPYVKSFSTSLVIPTAYWVNYNNFIDPDNNKEVLIRQEPMGAGFADTYQVPVIEGRNFNDALAATEKDKILINESAVKAFGWSHPVGKRIKSKGGNDVQTVIGVMKDFHYSTLESPIEPLLHSYTGKPGLANMSYLSMRLDRKQAGKVLAGIEEAFRKMPSRRSFSYHYMDELVEGQYALLDGILIVTNYVGVLTILISCMGMLGLIALFARRRVKEIGVRKVLGASVLHITTLLTKDFLKLVLLAILIAAPLAGWIMNKWLEDFAYRVRIQWWMFLAAGGIAFLLAMLTVAYQTIRAANANPVTSLRAE
jgi:putative ABC transport system permease protein